MQMFPPTRACDRNHRALELCKCDHGTQKQQNTSREYKKLQKTELWG